MVVLSLAVLAASPTFAVLPLPRESAGAQASALSDDGRVVYGRARFGGTEGTWRPCRWVDGRVETLPLPERVDIGGDSVDVKDTVGDGRIAVGTAPTAKGDRACRWVDGRLELLPLPAGLNSAIAMGVARDGTAVGAIQLRKEWRTVLWRSGRATVLPFPAGRSGLMVPRAISADGLRVVGEVDPRTGSGREAWEWRPSLGVRLLGGGDLFRRLPCGLSADGRTTLLVHQSAEGETGSTVLEGPQDYLYPDPEGAGATILSLPSMDAAGTAVALNVIRRSDGARSSWLWTKKAGLEEFRKAFGKKMPQGSAIARLSGIARGIGGRVVAIGSLEDGRPFVASVLRR